MISEAVATMAELTTLTVHLKSGVVPSPLTIAGLQGALLAHYVEISQDFSRKFHNKESKRIRRVLCENEEFQKIRKSQQIKTIKEADIAARLSVAEEWEKEIDAATEYELYKAMLSSLREAMSHCTMVLSLIKNQESNTRNT